MDFLKVFVLVLLFQFTICIEKTSHNEINLESELNQLEIRTSDLNGTSKDAVLKRSKRYLDFIAKTIVFYRANDKNALPINPTLWAYGVGVRTNMFIDNNPKARPFRRDVYDIWEEMLDKLGLDGKACLLKAFCTAQYIEEDVERDFGKPGILFKLLRHIFNLNVIERRYFPYLREENCGQILHSHCPLSFNNISPFTDDI